MRGCCHSVRAFCAFGLFKLRGEVSFIAVTDYQVNEEIRDREVRLIGEDGEQLGIMSSRDAMQIAIEKDLDLVKIAPGSTPPVLQDNGLRQVPFRAEQA